MLYLRSLTHQDFIRVKLLKYSIFMETLSLGPKNAVLEKFNPNEVLMELDNVLEFCRKKECDESLITDINNVKTC